MTTPNAHPIPFDARRRAKHLYWAGYTIEQVATLLDLNDNTLRSWKARDAWDDASPLERMEGVTEAQYCLLVLKEEKSGRDVRDIDLLGRQAERFARVRRFEQPGGHAGDLNPKIANRNAGEKKPQRKNHLAEEDQDKLRAAFEEGLFAYQLAWRTDLLTTSANVTRMILKSRQIGATFYFAREALIRALDTGNNQIFISASRAQANAFKQYIQAFVADVLGKKLEGDPIILDLDGVSGPMGEPPKLYFLGTNYRTAQSYHGDVYIDECFWIHGFEQLNKVASAMASQKRYRKTYFSTPSTIAHQAHAMWSGERFNARRAKDQRAKFDVSHDALKDGARGADGIWRQIVTLMDAEAKGCDLFDRAELELEYSTDEFANLFMCEFVDDSSSMFPFGLMRRAMIDSWDMWAKDFDPYALRPFGERPVWIGYDPAESAAGDDAALVIVAPPAEAGGKFRVLEKHRLRGKDFTAQAAMILEQIDRYNVEHIAIDTTGVGKAVWQLVAAKRPAITKAIHYSVETKTQMVLKAKNVFSAGRIEFDAGATDIAASFMAIRAELTGSQRQITYVASRAGDTGHADLAWAIMHALYNEPLDPADLGRAKSRMRIGHGQSSPDHPASRRRRRPGEPSAGRRDRRDRGYKPGRRAPLRIRGCRAGARSPRPARHDAKLVERALGRNPGADGRAGAHAAHVRASFVGAEIQGQPAAAVFRADAVADPHAIRRIRAEFPQPWQWLSAGNAQSGEPAAIAA
jgi:uncharacterized protein YjcR